MMGNSRHGGRKFRSIREAMDRRTVEGAKNARREAEADIRRASYVGPEGRGYDLVEDFVTGEQYVVKDLSGGRSMKPGSEVPIGGYSGSAAMFRLGSPAGGGSKFGAPSRGRRRYSTVEAAEEANQYAFGSGSTVAMLYNDGTFLSTRQTRIEDDLDTVCACILTDPSELVGDGSAITTSHQTWDVESDTVYSYTIPSGWNQRGNPYYRAGKIYWIESSDIEEPVGPPPITGSETFQFRLRRANTDWTSDETLATVTLTATDFGVPWTYWMQEVDDDEAQSVFVDDDAAVIYVNQRLGEPNGEGIEYAKLQYRITLSGTVSGSREYDTPDEPPLSTGATISGSSFLVLTYAGSDPSSVQLCSKGDNFSAGLSDLGSPFQIDSEATTALSASINAAASTFQVYGAAGEARYIARGTTSLTLVTDEVDDFTPGTKPYSMFYFGD